MVSASETATGEDATVPSRLTISDLETLRVISDPLRIRIIEGIPERPREPWTVKQLARRLETSATKLYYHVNLLEQHGLIKVTGSRLVSGILEKSYFRVAESFAIDRHLLAPGTSAASDFAIGQLLASVFDSTRGEIEEGLQRGVILGGDAEPHRRPHLNKSALRLTPARLVELRDRLTEVFEEYANDPDAPGTLGFGFLQALYPIEAPAPRRTRPRSSVKAGTAAPAREIS